jgi:predicted Zn-dependent peptidase
MSNVREEKGFTYGIGSYLWSLPTMGRFTISTQTATEFVEPAIGEIKKEMKLLCDSLIPADELDSVRSYMLGENARVLDGSFSFVDAYLSFLTQGVDGTDFYRKSEKTILSVTADELIGLARKYFDMERFCVSVAGQKTK